MSELTYDYAEPEGGEEGGAQGGESQDNLVTLRRSQIKTLEDRARRFSEAEKRATAAERRLAFIEAGVNPTDPKVKYFIAGYDGKTDPEAIRKAALEAGFIEAEPAKTDPEPQTPAAPPAAQSDPSQMTPDEAAVATQRQALAAMAAATRDLGIPVQGPPMQEQMLKALQARGSEGLAEFMRSVGLPVVEQ